MGLSPERKYEILSVKDYLDRSRDFLGQNGGPPRWFCPLECSNPPKDAPVLFFLPGIDGTGQALILHHQTLAELFEVRCLHIPASDRTPFEGLVKYVEEVIKLVNKVSPMKPMYIVGDSFGGCLALAVAACNPTIDLVLVLANPATSVNKSQLQPLFPLMESIPEQLHGTFPYFLTFVMGDPFRMAMANVEDELPLLDTVQELSNNLGALLPQLQLVLDYNDLKKLPYVSNWIKQQNQDVQNIRSDMRHAWGDFRPGITFSRASSKNPWKIILFIWKTHCNHRKGEGAEG